MASLIISGYIFFGKEFVRLWAGEGYDPSYYVGLLLMIPATMELIQYAESQGLGYRTVKFYRIEPYDYRVANQLLPSYNRHVLLVNTLIKELTKAGNHLCDIFRKCVNPGYRIAEGKLMIDGYCPEYNGEKKYPGLEKLEKMTMIKYPDEGKVRY